MQRDRFDANAAAMAVLRRQYHNMLVLVIKNNEIVGKGCPACLSLPTHKNAARQP